MAADIGAKIGLDGEKEFKNALQTTVAKIKTLQSSISALASDFKAGNISQEEYEKESKKLQSELKDQRGKLKDLQGELDGLSDKYGENDASVSKWQRQINKGVEEANRAATSVDKLGDETKKSGQEMKTASEKTSGWADVLKGSLLSSAITSGIKAIGRAVKEVSGALVTAVKDSSKFADEINTLSQQSGVSTDKLQEMSYAAKFVDVDIETVTKAMSKNIKSMTSAANGTGAAADAYAALGVEVTNADGSLRDSETVFWELIDALGKVDDETTRDSLSMSVFSKSAQELNPLILAGSERMAELAGEAHKVGYVLDSETLVSLVDVQDSIDRLDNSTEALKRTFASSFAPEITSALEKVNAELGKLIKAYDEDGLEGVVSAVADLANKISSEIAKPETVSSLVDAAKTILVTISNGITENLPSLASAAVDIVTELATEIAENSDILIESVFTLSETIQQSILDSAPQIAETATALVGKFAENLLKPENLEKVFKSASLLGLMGSLIKGIISAWPELFESAKNVVTNFSEGIKTKLSDLTEKGKEIVASVWEGFRQKVEDAKQWGKDLIKNFIDGIKQKWEDLKQGVKDIAQGIANFLGFSEPKEGPLSNFHTFAPDMMELFAKGIADNESLVRRQLAKSFDFGNFYALGGGTGAVRGGAAPSYNISLNINGAGISDANQLADLVISKLSDQITNTRGVFA